MKRFVLLTPLVLRGLLVTAVPLDLQDTLTTIPISPGIDAHDANALDVEGLIADEGSGPSPDLDGVPLVDAASMKKRQTMDPAAAALLSQLSPPQLTELLTALAPDPQKPTGLVTGLLAAVNNIIPNVLPSVVGLLDSVLGLLLPAAPRNNPTLSALEAQAIVPQQLPNPDPGAVLSALGVYESTTAPGAEPAAVRTVTVEAPSVCVATTVTITQLQLPSIPPLVIPSVSLPSEPRPVFTLPSLSIPSILLPSLVLPTLSIPPISLPSLSLPSLSLPTVSAPQLSIPSVSVPRPSIPSLSIPSLALPTISLPSLSLPPISIPSISIPSISAPLLSVPSVSISPISIPSISVPRATLPSISVPSISVPRLTPPSISIPSLSLPSIQLPQFTLVTTTLSPIPGPTLVIPSISFPPLSFPSLSIPPLSLPSISTPRITLPSIAVPTGPLPSISIPGIPVPTIPIPQVQLPTLVIPSLVFPSVSIPSLSIPTFPPLSLPTISPVTISPIQLPTLVIPSLVFPSVSLPPLSIPPIQVPTLPPLSIPALPPLSLPTLPPFSIPTLPPLSIPTLSLPTLVIPSIALPSVSLPSLSTPQVQLPTLSLPPLQLPTLPALTLLRIQLPTLPPLPILSLPPLSIPSLQLPTLSIPPFPLPTLPSLPLLPTEIPGLTLPGITGGLSIGVSAGGPLGTLQAGLPISVGLPGLTIPPIPLPTLPPITLAPAVQPVIPRLLEQLSSAVVSQTALVPGILGALSGLLAPALPTQTAAEVQVLPSLLDQIASAVTAVPSVVPNLLDQLDSLLAPVTSAIPVAPTATPTTLLTSVSRPPLIPIGPIISAATSVVGDVVQVVKSYLFNPRSASNLVVYYGQSEATARISLGMLCEDPNVDIVVLGFITAITAEGSIFPRIQLNTPIPGTTTPLMSVQARGLLYYASLEADIQTCQSRYGKKILLSIGGATSSLVLRSDQQAIQFANTLWALFGPTGYVPEGLRPFGRAVVDGFDLVKNDGSPGFFGTFATALRASFATDLAKDYFLSAAPGCVHPDASVPQAYLSQCNFVWPQFFNNPACEVGSAGFIDSVFQWSRTLGDGIVPMRDSSAFRTRLLVGIPGWLQAAPLTFLKLGGVRGAQLLAAQLRGFTGLINLGGLMIWDGPQGLENIQDGLSILGWAKSGLRG